MRAEEKRRGSGSAEFTWESLEELRPYLRAWIARRCEDENDIDDIVQETFLRAARYRGSLTSADKLRGWATRIAANVLSDCFRRDWRLRRAASEAWALDEVEAERAGEDSQERIDGPPLLHVGGRPVHGDEALAHLDGVLAGLRPGDRDVLRSYYDGSQSCRETARECCIPVTLVKVRLFRARERVRRALRRRLALATPSLARRVGL